MRKILILIFCLFAAPLWAGPTDALLDKLVNRKNQIRCRQHCAQYLD